MLSVDKSAHPIASDGYPICGLLLINELRHDFRMNRMASDGPVRIRFLTALYRSGKNGALDLRERCLWLD